MLRRNTLSRDDPSYRISLHRRVSCEPDSRAWRATRPAAARICCWRSKVSRQRPPGCRKSSKNGGLDPGDPVLASYPVGTEPEQMWEHGNVMLGFMQRND